MSMDTIIGTPILKVNRNSDSLSRDNTLMSIGNRIRAARRARGLTQKELAASVGISQATLSELETGESAGTTMLATFAKALKVNAYYLETGIGPKEYVEHGAPAETNTQEEELLAAYRSANAAERDLFESIMRSVLRRISAEGARKEM